MKLLLNWLINALFLLLISYLVPGISIQSFYIALIIVLVLGFINILIKPIILFLTLPINIITLGLFTFVINGFLFWVASTFIKGFFIASFGDALIGAAILSLLIFGREYFLNSDN